MFAPMDAYPYIALGFLLLVVGYLATGYRYRRIRAKQASTAPPPPARQLDQYELALLSGGKRRVGEALFANLYLHDYLRFTPGGRLRGPAEVEPLRAGEEPAHPLEVATLRTLRRAGTTRVSQLYWHVAQHPWVDEALSRLRAEGLLLEPDQLFTVRGLRNALMWAHRGIAFVLGVVVCFFGLFATAVQLGLGATRALGNGFAAVELFAVPLVMLCGVLGFFRAYRYFGIAGIVLFTALVAALALLVVEPFADLGGPLFSCLGALLVGYGGYVWSGRVLGPRTLAADALLEQWRASTRTVPLVEAPWIGLFVALFGPAELTRTVRRASTGGAASDRAVALVRVFQRLGVTHRFASTTSHAGGSGGSFGVHGDANADMGGGSGSSGGGGDGGGGGSGGGGGGGDG
ncbi:uncharacterized protein (TIGR04222 family) [Tamaricihabitans halophyticus]|uniref:Uncharacterized protein (TIGR04222 family) n=1 Tax=Tamaricihabitans halophyticus TaxID=1262583 RepID=A0A4R2QQQ6_9PSEU|nr:TIGR04222 domain-containing membrane protein [Tamaricihabitans halophyticus]TCP51937.1 uncharacterized protein (TIGR04222 family) [Tamaricihabitans halophyticus]